MNVLAVDPGGTTGIAWRAYDEFWSEEDTGFDAAYNRAAEMLESSGAWDALVCETFIIRKQTAHLDPVAFNTTTDLIGACRALALEHDIPFIRQTPAEAKAFATDDKLRRMGWWSPSPGGHQNDAARHLLTYLAKQRYYPVLAQLAED